MSSDIQTVTLIGAGVLGSQIAYQTAYCGYSVVAYDVNDKALDAARANFRALPNDSRYISATAVPGSCSQ